MFFSAVRQLAAAALVALAAGPAVGSVVADAPWPPVVEGDPHPVVVTIPSFWPEPEKDVARLWVALQQETRVCLLAEGVDYRYSAPWVHLDPNGRAVPRSPPPTDWGPAFETPPRASAACFDRALALVGCPHPNRAVGEAPAVAGCHRVAKHLDTDPAPGADSDDGPAR